MNEEIEDLRQKRDRLWAKVCTVTSTRWDLTRFEKADDEYRAAAGADYVKMEF